MKTSEIRKMTTEEINAIHDYGGGICPECEVEMDQIDKPHKIKQMRHDIARLKTVLNERKEDK